jgi:hypothetical protein
VASSGLKDRPPELGDPKELLARRESYGRRWEYGRDDLSENGARWRAHARRGGGGLGVALPTLNLMVEPST